MLAQLHFLPPGAVLLAVTSVSWLSLHRPEDDLEICGDGADFLFVLMEVWEACGSDHANWVPGGLPFVLRLWL